MNSHLYRTLCKTLLIFSVAFLQFGCGSQPVADVAENLPVESLLELGRAAMDDNRFEEAILIYRKLESRFPYGKPAEQAQLDIAYAHYRNGDPELAVAVGRRETLTEASQSEQKGAGLDRCTADEYQAFSELNRQYRERFGFPFIMAVKGFQRGEILAELRRRVDNNREQEFETAVSQVIRIGRLRTEAILDAEAGNDA